MLTDQELLRQYADEGTEAAFAEVVRRHVDFVHSIAWRIAGPDAHLAEDITQRVFTDLARKAQALSHYQSLASWLHRCTRFAALAATRVEQRRRKREQEATAMQDSTSTPSPEISWERLRPLLDEAVDQLGQSDREAVLLRFFHDKSHREVGAALGLSENSANKRIERALEKLREYFSRRGVTTTSAILGAAISANSVQATPAGLAVNVSREALASTAVVGIAGGSLFFAFLSMSTKTKTIISLIVILAMATVALRLQNQNESRPEASSAVPSLPKTPVANSIAHALPQVATPLVVPVRPMDTSAPAPASSTASAKPDATPPELRNMIAQIIATIQSGDRVAVIEDFIPPEELAAMTPKQKAYMEKELSKPERNSSRGPDALLDTMKALDGLTPTFNETGDTAKFRVPITEAGKAKLLGQGIPPPPTITETFVKRDGKWYLKNMGYPYIAP